MAFLVGTSAAQRLGVYVHTRLRASALCLLLACACGGSGDANGGSTEADAPTGGAATETLDTSGSGSESSASSEGPDGGTTSGSETTTDTDAASVTYAYYRDIAPIIEGRCATCHEAGGVAPFPLTSYDEVAMYGALISAVVDAGTMPPWPAADGCNTYRGDTSLSQEQVDMFRTWVDEGSPAGDPDDVGDALPDLSIELPRIDVELALEEAHVPVPDEPGGYDEHVCFLLDWPGATEQFIRGYEVLPTNLAAAHHAVIRIVPPDDVENLRALDEADPKYGWACGAGTGMTAGQGALLGGWIPGGGASVFPDGTGLKIEPGSAILMNMHYNLVSGDLTPDQTRIDLMVEDTVERQGRSLFILDPSWPVGDNMLIPAGATGVEHQADFGLGLLGDVDIHQVAMHMHTFARTGKVWISREDGSQTCAVDIPSWDFDWQLTYPLEEPVRLSAGDRLNISCSFDNALEDQPTEDGAPAEPRDITWGEDTYDEMCMAIVYAVPAQ